MHLHDKVTFVHAESRPNLFNRFYVHCTFLLLEALQAILYFCYFFFLFLKIVWNLLRKLEIVQDINFPFDLLYGLFFFNLFICYVVNDKIFHQQFSGNDGSKNVVRIDGLLQFKNHVVLLLLFLWLDPRYFYDSTLWDILLLNGVIIPNQLHLLNRFDFYMTNFR